MTARRDHNSDIIRATPRPHIPVLLEQVVAALAPADDALMVDGTFGAGGYTHALLRSADCAVVAIDRDETAIRAGADLQNEYGARLQFVQGCFGDMQNILTQLGVAQADGIVLDLGVSSMQIDDAARGFSFMRDGALDMRMGQSGITAADIVNDYQEQDLAQIIAVYGEEKRARAIAKAITTRRVKTRITRTSELASLIEDVIGRAKSNASRIHPATRTFQALRIYLNDELGELWRGLVAGEQLLSAGGRLAIVTFHSLEDRMVKQFLSRRAGRVPRPSRHLPEPVDDNAPSFSVPPAQTPSEKEVADNPRARSARLRFAVRTNAPPFPLEDALLPRLDLSREAASLHGGQSQ